MRYLIGSKGIPSCQKIVRSVPDMGLLLTPSSWRTALFPYALDNGVYAAWQQGRGWDEGMHADYIKMLDKIPPDNPPLWVLLPDAVADWPRTVELALLYLPVLRERNLPVAIALQDGCDFERVLDFAPHTVFVAGSTTWKLANVHPACDFFHPHGIGVHVGRVNTAQRLRLCQSAGVESVDGTTLNKYLNATLPLIANTLRQPCLQL